LNEFDLRCAAEDYDRAANVLIEIDFDCLLLWGHYPPDGGDAREVTGEDWRRKSKSRSLNNSGASSYSTGQIQGAIACCEEGLLIDRETKNRQWEGVDLSNLGIAYATLGQTQRAIEFYEQARAIAREIGARYGEGHRLDYLAESLIAEKRYAEAIQSATDGAKIGEEVSSPVLGSWSNYFHALAHLYAGNPPAARAAAESARQYDEPQNNHNVLALLGIIALRQNDHAAAQEAFTAAIAHADVMLERSAQNYSALDAKGVALCGLGLCDDNGQDRIERTNQAAEVFRAARAINKDAGYVARVVRLLDALAPAVPDGTETLKEARKINEPMN